MRYVALRRLDCGDYGFMEPGQLLPQEFTDGWQQNAAFHLINSGRISLVPEEVAELPHPPADEQHFSSKPPARKHYAPYTEQVTSSSISGQHSHPPLTEDEEEEDSELPDLPEAVVLDKLRLETSERQAKAAAKKS